MRDYDCDSESEAYNGIRALTVLQNALSPTVR